MRHLFSGFPMALLAVCLSLFSVRAFPPEPDGLIYGMVKDQYGTPLRASSDQVVLITPSGVQVSANIEPGLAVGINYALQVPMDAGVISKPYVPNALQAGAQYKLYVAVGAATNLPIEMLGTNSVLGAPAQQTRQDLTLGTDANGDGIPDAWEQVFLSEIGSDLSLTDLDPNADYAHDGRSLRQEYLLGNYPFNPTNAFKVQLVSQRGGSAVLAFTTTLGRTYTVLGSSDLKNWTALSFTNLSAGSDVMSSYYAPDVRPLQIQTVAPAQAPKVQFFRIELQ